MKFGLFAALKLCMVPFILSLALATSAQAQDEFYLSLEEKFLVNYLILGAGKAPSEKLEIIKKIEQLFQSASRQAPLVIKVQNFNEFIENFRGQWPTGVSIQEALKLAHHRYPNLRLRVYTSDSSRVQRKIDAFLLAHFKDLQQAIGTKSVESFVESLKSQSQINIQLHGTKDNPLKISDEIRLMLFEKPEMAFHAAMERFSSVGQSIAQSDMIKLKHEGLQAFLQKALTLYFNELSPEVKTEILANYLNGNLRANEIEQFKIMVMNSGPQFQKLLQIISREAGLGAELQVVFKELESSVQAMPKEHVERLLQSEMQNYKIVSFEYKPLGVGTMAQVHRAKIIDANGKVQNVIVRFLKPQIEDRILMDKKILAKLGPIVDADPAYRNSGFPALTPLVDDLSNTVQAELNLKQTIELQLLAKAAYETERLVNFGGYKNYVHIRVPGIVRTEGHSSLMVQDMAFGKKLDKAAQELEGLIPNFKQKIAEEIATIWTEEVLFKSGFFHSDLHQGNFLVNFKEQAIDVTILDYGMAGTISKEIQAKALGLGIGIELLKTEAISEGFWALSMQGKDLINRTQFESLVAERVKKIKCGELPNDTFEKWTAWAIDQGLRYPPEFISLNRGLIIIQGMLTEAQSPKTITSIAKSAALHYPIMVARLLKSSKMITTEDLIRLGWEKIAGTPEPTANYELPPLEGRSCRSIF